MSVIRKISVGVNNGVVLFLPPHKRQSKRLAWLQGLVNPYAENEAAFYTWRDEMIIRAMVTGQKASLQWYLNHLYDPILQRIIIDDSVAVGTAVSLESEGTAWVVAGIEGTVGESGVVFALEGETTGSLPKDFRVLTPNTVNTTQLKATVDLYNSAHKSYDIVTF